MTAKNTILPLPNHAHSPIMGEEALYSMLQWGEQGDRAPGPCAALVQLNWATDSASGPLRNRTMNGRLEPDFSLTAGRLAGMLDTLANEAPPPEMIYFTGNDPAGHPQLYDLIELAYEKGISRIGLQCDGLRIAHDDRFLTSLARLKPMLFLEFDGFDETASLILHGRRDLPFEAKRALDRLATAGLPAALLTSVARGINLQEVGAIAAFGLKHPAVFSAIFRPIPPGQNRLGAPPTNHVTAASIMEALERQSRGLFNRDGFVPALCCRPDRHFVAQVPVVHQAPAGPVNSMSRPAPSPGARINGASALEDREPCFWLGVHEFMTHWSKNIRQARYCPLVIITPDGRKIPYCLYNAQEAE